VAIVDQGAVVAQGSIAELRGGSGRSVVVEVDEPGKARTLLAAHPAVESVVDDGGILRVLLDGGGIAAVPDLNRRLVEAGLAVRRLEPQQASLEQRFLEITTRLENAA
jgi:ABC-2 type transport system ATP-binding protein